MAPIIWHLMALGVMRWGENKLKWVAMRLTGSGGAQRRAATLLSRKT